MTGRLRVVIVEDVEADAELMALRLLEAGFQADWQRVDLEEDFLATLEASPDLILADWNLPQFSGIRALQCTRARGLDVPFIIVSGSIGEETAVDALRAGADDYVIKDRPARLGPAVRRAIEERELRKERRRNHEELLLLRRAVEHSPVSVVVTGQSGNIEYVNPKFTEVSGYTFDEMRGKNPRLLKSGEQPASFYKELWETILGGNKWHGEFHNRRKDGTLYWERASISPVLDSSGVMTHFVAVKEDVTAQKFLESELLQAQKMESVGRLAGGVAHDFNNLLTVINGYSELLLEGLDPDDPLRTRMEAIHKAGTRAAGLTRQLLTFSRKHLVEPQAVEVDREIGGIQQMLSRILGEDVEVRMRLGAPGALVHADPHQLNQVIMNLAVNARDAISYGGTLSIETSVVDRKGQNQANEEPPVVSHVMIEVSDSGAGMSEETKLHMFEPFFTTKEPGKGTGLGLSIVHGIVTQCGGQIEVFSELNLGTVFRIYLPRLEEAPVENAPEEPATRGDWGTETVLAVEDEAEALNYTAVVLESHGYHVLAAANAAEALLLCERQKGPIDLVLTDVVMPDVSGPQLVEQLAMIRPGIQVLYMSGYTGDAMTHRGIIAEGAKFIQKPFRPAELIARVRATLGPRKAARILVADDEAGIREYFRTVLEAAGYEVIEAVDGRQLIARVKSERVDLALIDLVMPEHEGLEAIRALRKAMPHVRIIAVSGGFGARFLHVAQLLGADATLGKPVDPETLLAQVGAVMRAQR